MIRFLLVGAIAAVSTAAGAQSADPNGWCGKHPFTAVISDDRITEDGGYCDLRLTADFPRLQASLYEADCWDGDAPSIWQVMAVKHDGAMSLFFEQDAGTAEVKMERCK